ncbi:MAG: carboxylating nicotinate-nucleotide diphosphorylase, partial [Actinomycetota bacterium]
MARLPPLDPALLDALAARGLAEDVGPEGDVTTAPIAPPGAAGSAVVVAKAAGVLAGGPVAEAVFRAVSPDVSVAWAA